MPRVNAPETIRGARGARDAQSVTQVRGPETVPQVKDRELEPEQAHFVSAFKEYAIVIATEPDHVNSQGQIVKGVNKNVRFRDFQLITSDPIVIQKIRTGMGRAYGIRCEVWEKWQQDRDLAQRALETAEAAIDNLPEEMKLQFAERLAAKFSTFQLPPKTQPNAPRKIAATQEEVEEVTSEDEEEVIEAPPPIPVARKVIRRKAV